MSNDLMKNVPRDIEAEEAVLGALILDRDSVIKIADKLKPRDFYLDRHVYAYRAVLTLYERREPPDPVTLASELKRVGKLDEVGGLVWIMGLVDKCPTAVHIEHYARIVKLKAFSRRLISAGGRISAEGYGDHEDEATALANAEAILAGVASSRNVKGYATMEEMLDRWGDRFDRLQNSPGNLVGVPSGYSDLDEITGGWQPGELIVFGARPGNGKSAILVDQALSMIKATYRVGMQSLEMSEISLLDRLVANYSCIDSSKFRRGLYLSQEELGRVMEAQGQLSRLPLYVDEEPGLAMTEIRARAHRLKAEKGLDLLMVDYLQKVANPRKDGNRINEVGEVARKLKDLARELDVPVLVAAQLTRLSETRTNHEPTLADFADSSEIEKEADVAILMHRPELYDRSPENAGIVKLKVAKNRGGPAGNTIPLRFVKDKSQFQEMATSSAYAWAGHDDEE